MTNPIVTGLILGGLMALAVYALEAFVKKRYQVAFEARTRWIHFFSSTLVLVLIAWVVQPMIVGPEATGRYWWTMIQMFITFYVLVTAPDLFRSARQRRSPRVRP